MSTFSVSSHLGRKERQTESKKSRINGKCSVVYHYCSLWLPGNKRGLVSGVLLFRGFFCGEMDGCLMPSIITFPSSLCSADWRGRKRVSSSGQAKREKNVRTRFWPISPSPLSPFFPPSSPSFTPPIGKAPLSSQGSKGGAACLPYKPVGEAGRDR